MSTEISFTKQNLLLLATVTLAFTAFCVETDVYTPSFPDMVNYFSTSEGKIQQILTANFIGLCLSCLCYGPLSDAFGRKPFLSIGLGIFTVSSLACLFTQTIDQLIFWRFIQGVGCGAIIGIALTMVFDFFPKESSARLIAILNSFVTGIMAFAPLLGNYININFGWRANFILIALLALLSLLATVFLIKETHPPAKRKVFSIKQIAKDYIELSTSLTFMGNTLIWNIMFGLLMVFTANLSLIFVDYFHIPQDIFGFYQASIMAVFFVASLLASKLIAIYGLNKTKQIGNVLFILGVASIAWLANLSSPNPVALTSAMSLVGAGVAICCTIYFVDSMAPFPESMGIAQSLCQSMRLFISGAMVWLASLSFDGSVKPISSIAIIATLIVVTLHIALQVQKNGLKVKVAKKA